MINLSLLIIFILLIAKLAELNHRNKQTYSVKYKINDQIIPVRIEFDDSRQIEYVMNLHSDKGGRNSVTFYDFKQGVVIYKELTARECYIARLTYETLERERAKLERKKNFIIDSSTIVTVYATNKAIPPSKMKSLIGVRGARFCRGMHSYLIGDKYDHHYRSKREASHFVQRSYGHYGQHNTNYAHYGHETYTIGSFGTKFSKDSGSNGTDGPNAQFPVFILLPLSQQSNIQIKHNGGYQLQLPIGQLKSSYSGDINEGETPIKAESYNHTKDGINSFIRDHKWFPIQINKNSTNGTDINFPGMIIIPGLAKNILYPNATMNFMESDKKSEISNHKEVNIDVHLKTTENNSTAFGNAKVGGHRSFVSGSNLGKGRFIALSQLDSNDTNLYNKVQGNSEETEANATIFIPGEANARSKAKATFSTGNTSAESALQFPIGDAKSQVVGNNKLSKALAKSRSDFSTSGTHANITQIKSKVHSLRGEVNASARYKDQKGRSEASLRNQFSRTSSFAKSFGSFQSQLLNSAPYSPLTKTEYVIRPLNSRKHSNSHFSQSPSSLNNPVDLKSQKTTLETRSYNISYDIQPENKTFNAKQPNHLFPDVAYPNVTVENIIYPQYLLLPSRSRNADENVFRGHSKVHYPTSKTQHNAPAIRYPINRRIQSQNHSIVYPILIQNKNLFSNHNKTSNFGIRNISEMNIVRNNQRTKFIKNPRKNKIRPNIYTDENRKQISNVKSRHHFRTDVYNKTKERDKGYRKSINPLLIGMQCCRYPLQRSQPHCCARKSTVNLIQYPRTTIRSKCAVNKKCHFLYRTTQRIQICKVDDAKMC